MNSYIPFRSGTLPIGDVLRENAGVDTAIGTLINKDRPFWKKWMRYDSNQYAAMDIITKQFKLQANVNQLSKLELYPTSNVKNETPLAAKIRNNKVQT